MTYGTSYFVSRAAAVRYYRATEGEHAPNAVERKLAEGQIHIGKPELKPGDILTVIDNGTRYAIKEASVRKPTEDSVTRYVVTYVNRDGMRTLVGAAQGRNTYATEAEAQRFIDAMRKNNSASTLAMFGTPDTLEVRPCECWPGHFDPKGVWFD